MFGRTLKTLHMETHKALKASTTSCNTWNRQSLEDSKAFPGAWTQLHREKKKKKDGLENYSFSSWLQQFHFTLWDKENGTSKLAMIFKLVKQKWLFFKKQQDVQWLGDILMGRKTKEVYDDRF